MSPQKVLLVIIVNLLLQACSSKNHSASQPTSTSDPDAYQPITIAHRGASGYLPEHTLEAVTLAYAQGADFIEQDLVLTKDLVPVVLHDIHLDTVTNVAQRFPERKRKDGRYYAFDFTLSEIKTLTVHERKQLSGKQVFPKRYQGQAHFTVATFEEQIELISQLNRQFNQQIGFYPEIKSPQWHKAQGADISDIVLTIIRKHKLDDPKKPIYLQCFDFDETKRIRTELGAKLKLIQLIGENKWKESKTDNNFLKTQKGLLEVKKYAQGIGPWLPQVLTSNTYKVTDLYKQAKMLGLAVHPYTLRADALPQGITEPMLIRLLKEAKVDGIFTDFPDRF